jgi:hypothetical protein
MFEIDCWYKGGEYEKITVGIFGENFIFSFLCTTIDD